MTFKKTLLTTMTAVAAISSGYALANTVIYTVNKPATIIYQVAHQNLGQPPILGARQEVRVDHSVAIPVNLDGYRSTGIVTDNVDGHELPASAKQFGALKSCTLKTTQNKPEGNINLTMSTHSISCKHS